MDSRMDRPPQLVWSPRFTPQPTVEQFRRMYEPGYYDRFYIPAIDHDPANCPKCQASGVADPESKSLRAVETME